MRALVVQSLEQIGRSLRLKMVSLSSLLGGGEKVAHEVSIAEREQLIRHIQ